MYLFFIIMIDAFQLQRLMPIFLFPYKKYHVLMILQAHGSHGVRDVATLRKTRVLNFAVHLFIF